MNWAPGVPNSAQTISLAMIARGSSSDSAAAAMEEFARPALSAYTRSELRSWLRGCSQNPTSNRLWIGWAASPPKSWWSSRTCCSKAKYFMAWSRQSRVAALQMAASGSSAIHWEPPPIDSKMIGWRESLKR